MKFRSPALLAFLAPPLWASFAFAQVAPLPAASTLESPQPRGRYTFVLRADHKLRSASVVGTFNKWDKNANQMTADADGLTWRATLPLAPGKYAYKFVLDGTDWQTDPTTASETDGDGNANSVLTLTPKGNASAVAPPVSTPGNADKVFVLTPDKERSEGAVPHLFTFRADKKLDSVAVAGQFNGWNSGANPLSVAADGLTWTANLRLVPGAYQYKFVVNGDTWVLDPKQTGQFKEPDGNINSLLLVTPPDYTSPASPDDGQTTVSALRHTQSASDLNYDQGHLSFSLRARTGDLRAVSLVVGARRVPMKMVGHDDLFARYQTDVAWDGESALSYRFELSDGARTELFGADGVRPDAKLFQISAKTFRPFIVPTWVEKTVFYQIFPDRFENGDKSNDPPNVVAWGSAPLGNSRFGGDIAGVEKHLGYLSDLGVSGVYFNPVFQSPSNHRYDAQDYKRIDPQFGTNAQFAALTRQLQARHIRTVMDFVFNHTSTRFAPFVDLQKNGAASRYKDWYLVKSFPIRVQNPPTYVGWYGYAAMPKLNLLNPATDDYMLGLVNFWKREVPLAGLRLDVADEVDIRFWRQLRTRVKSLDPQMWIVGERWNDASPWLRGDQWDSAMNYPFLFANADFAEGKASPSQFTRRLIDIYHLYPPQVSRAMLNVLSSHDTPRFLTRVKDDARLQRLAATIQFTWVGAPSVYYGEELGMEGGADPDNRRGMEWKRARPDNPMLRFYKRLIAIRNHSRALQSGVPAILLADDTAQTLAYSRTLGTERAIITLNRSDKSQTLAIPLPPHSPAYWRDGLSDKVIKTDSGTSMRVQLSPFSSAILLPRA